MTSPQLLFVHALSPLHAGTGQSIGAIDLAIARDRATQFPYLPGSSLKGCLRDVAGLKFLKGTESDKDLIKKLFGPDTTNASEQAGSLIVSDANLLLLPVRSVAGTFAWVTSPYLLHRFFRDVKAAGLSIEPPPVPADVSACVIGKSSSLVAHVDKTKKVIFEDLDFNPNEESSLDKFASWLGMQIFEDSFFQANLAQRLCIVHDDVMTFLSEHATDVVARIALEDDTKTVKQGALWYEESLPTESILVGLVCAQPVKQAEMKPEDVMKRASELMMLSIQLGGKATVGRGRCQLRLSGGRS
jgi:CRISPR-associated protein Cmr4